MSQLIPDGMSSLRADASVAAVAADDAVATANASREAASIAVLKARVDQSIAEATVAVSAAHALIFAAREAADAAVAAAVPAEFQNVQPKRVRTPRALINVNHAYMNTPNEAVVAAQGK